MTDLTSLFGPRSDDGDDRGTENRAPDAAALQALVGKRSEERAEQSSPGAGLSAIVGGSPSDEKTGRPDLSTLIGSDRREEIGADSRRLAELVGSDGRAVDVGSWTSPESNRPARPARFGGRDKAGARDHLSRAAAVLAIAALISTAAFSAVQRATANPADDAVVSLGQREAELMNETAALQTAVDLHTASVTEATELAETSAPVLSGLQGRVDDAALAAAETLRATLQAVATSADDATDSVPVYRRASIDETSLASVAGAIDGVRAARESLAPLLSSARSSRGEVLSALQSFRGQLETLAAAIQSEGSTVVAENSAARSAFRAAVTDAVDQMVAARASGGDGLSEMALYAVAVDALRAENARILGIAQEEPRSPTPVVPAPRRNGSGTTPGGSSSAPRSPSSSPSPSASPAPSPSTAPSQPASPAPADPSTPPPSSGDDPTLGDILPGTAS